MSNINNFKKHFVFDLDDTLVDGRFFCGETLARSFAVFIPDIDKNLVITLHDQLHGTAVPELYTEIAKMMNLKLDMKKNLPKLLELDKQIQVSEIHRLKTFDGVTDILGFLKSNGKKIHMCTNRPMSSLIPALEYNDIKKFFKTTVSCLDEGHKKPDPKCLLDIIKNSGDRKEDFIYFGDSVVDCELSKNAGIEFIVFDQYLNEKNLFKKLINMFLEDKINNIKKTL